MTDQNLIFRNDHEIKTTSQYFNEYLPKYQQVINEFSDLQLGNIETRNDLIQAVNNPDGFIASRIEQKITNDNPVLFGGFRLKPAALAQMIDIKEKQEFIKACNDVKHSIHYFSRIGTVKKGRVEVDKSLLDAYIRQNTLVAATEKEKAINEAMLLIKQGVEALAKMNLISFDQWDVSLSNFIIKDGQKSFRVNSDHWQVWSR